MFEIVERTKLKVKIYGKEYDVKKPTVGDLEGLQVGMDDLKDGEKLHRVKGFVVSMGIPEDTIQDLEMDQFLSLIEFLSQSKKK